MTIDPLVNIQGALAEAFKQLDPNTIQHSYEIMNARRSDQSLRDLWFYTADSALYRVEKQPILYFGNRDTNLIFKNIDEATQQLIKGHNYIPSKRGIGEVVASVKSGSTLRIKLSDLELKNRNEEYSHFEIDTKKYNKLNEVQRAFAERVYGQGSDFKQNMKMLNDMGIKTTIIQVLNPAYVNANIKQDSAIVRVCMLEGVGEWRFWIGNSALLLSYWGLGGDEIRIAGDPDYSLRGVLLH